MIEKANRELEEKIAREGQDSVRIDKYLIRMVVMEVGHQT